MGIGCFPPKRLQFRKNHRAVCRQSIEEPAESAAGQILTYLLLWIIVRSCAESREAVAALRRRPAGPKRLSMAQQRQPREDAHDRASNAKVTNH